MKWYSTTAKRAENKLRLQGAADAALKLQTIFKDEHIGGVVFFNLENLNNEFNISFDLLGDNYKVEFKLP